MGVQSVTKEVNGREIKITQFFAIRGQKIQTKLFKLVLPVLGEAFGSLDRKNITKEVGIKIETALPKALTALSDRLDPEDFQKFMLELLSSTAVDNRVIDEKVFNDIFAGNYSLMFRLAYETIMANNFFDLGDTGIDLSAMMQTVSPEK